MSTLETVLKNQELPEMVCLTRKKYDELVKRSIWLRCLEYAGVDNWSGISYAYDIKREEYPDEA